MNLTKKQKEALTKLFTTSKIKVNSSTSKEVQEVAFEVGWAWMWNRKDIQLLDKPYLYFWEDKKIHWSWSFTSEPYKIITVEQIREIIAPPKLKAYVVWHDGMLNDEAYRTISDISITYAETPSKAKAIAMRGECYDWEICGEKPKYTDLRVKRVPGADKIEFEGKHVSKSHRDLILKEREKKQVMIDMVNSFPDNALFLIQNSFIGNAMSFWRKGNAGYTTNLKEVQVYTKDQILKMLPLKEEMKIWEYYHIMENTSLVCDSQNLDYNKRISSF